MASSYFNTNSIAPVKVDGKIIGTLEGNKFIKPVKGSKHQLRHPPAWAIDANAFDNEILPSASEIVIHDKETGIKYHTSIDSFDRLKRSFDRGFGR